MNGHDRYLKPHNKEHTLFPTARGKVSKMNHIKPRKACRSKCKGREMSYAYYQNTVQRKQIPMATEISGTLLTLDKQTMPS